MLGGYGSMGYGGGMGYGGYGGGMMGYGGGMMGGYGGGMGYGDSQQWGNSVQQMFQMTQMMELNAIMLQQIQHQCKQIYMRISQLFAWGVAMKRHFIENYFRKEMNEQQRSAARAAAAENGGAQPAELVGRLEEFRSEKERQYVLDQIARRIRAGMIVLLLMAIYRWRQYRRASALAKACESAWSNAEKTRLTV
ncbi:unnamed protein product [Amoebophrya sp. A25]|nr:unnamed protein product [Amoebophrya sp. A25]|eukprot:GSA25T00018940001.1